MEVPATSHAARVPFSAGPPIVGLAVFGETRPALAEVAAADVPTLSQWMLIALGVALGAIALCAVA